MRRFFLPLPPLFSGRRRSMKKFWRALPPFFFPSPHSIFNVKKGEVLSFPSLFFFSPLSSFFRSTRDRRERRRWASFSLLPFSPPSSLLPRFGYGQKKAGRLFFFPSFPLFLHFFCRNAGEEKDEESGLLSFFPPPFPFFPFPSLPPSRSHHGPGRRKEKKERSVSFSPFSPSFFLSFVRSSCRRKRLLSFPSFSFFFPARSRP